MRLLELSSLLIGDFARKAVRMAIAGGIVLVCGFIVAIESVAAARVALEPSIGPVWARLAVAGAFTLIAAGSVTTLLWLDRRASRAKTARDAHGEDPRAAIIAEAISLGYSLGRDFMNAAPAEPETPEPNAKTRRKPPANGAAEDSRPRG